MKIIRGRKSELDCVVELDNESYRTKLSLEKILKIANHSPDGVQWGYSGSGEKTVSCGDTLRNHGRRRPLT